MLIPVKSLEILAKEIDYHTFSLVIRKLRIKVGCGRATSKTITGKMNVIRISHKVPTQVQVEHLTKNIYYLF